MTDSQLSIELQRSPLDSSSEAEEPQSYLVDRLKYENLLKEEAIFKASKLIQELKEEADMLRRANHQLAQINANKTNEIKELERMLRGCYRETQHEKEVEDLLQRLHEKDLKIRKLQLIIRKEEIGRSQKEVEARYRTIFEMQNRSGDENHRRQNCRTENESHSPHTSTKHGHRSAQKQSSPNRKYFSSAVAKVTPTAGKHHSGVDTNLRTASTAKRKVPQGQQFEKTTECKTEPALAELEIEVNKLRSHIEQKDEQILLLMKRNKAIDTIKQSATMAYNVHKQPRYRNARDYHLHKVQSHSTSSSIYPC